MSFSADPVLLFAAGELYARLLPESAQGGMATAAGAMKVGAFEVVGIASYLDADWARPLWKPFGAKSGTDFMVAWPFAHGKRRRRDAKSDAAAALMFGAVYPLAWWLG